MLSTLGKMGKSRKKTNKKAINKNPKHSQECKKIIPKLNAFFME